MCGALGHYAWFVLVQCGSVGLSGWAGLGWFGLGGFWYGLVWFSLVWFGLVWFGVRYDVSVYTPR